jgi:hypothetical protein
LATSLVHKLSIILNFQESAIPSIYKLPPPSFLLFLLSKPYQILTLTLLWPINVVPLPKEQLMLLIWRKPKERDVGRQLELEQSNNNGAMAQLYTEEEGQALEPVNSASP